MITEILKIILDFSSGLGKSLLALAGCFFFTWGLISLAHWGLTKNEKNSLTN